MDEIKVLVAHTTVSFVNEDKVIDEDGNESYEISLEEDTVRVGSNVTSTSGFKSVTYNPHKYVRMYYHPAISPKVTAVTGTLARVGSSIKKNAGMLGSFSPDNQAIKVPSWAINVRMTMMGKAISETGVPVPEVKVKYNSGTKEVTTDARVHAVFEIRYDAPYELFRYRFSGACPISPPSDKDDKGSDVEDPDEYFDPGMLLAVDAATGSSATLNLSAPSCSWSFGGSSYDKDDKEKERKPPKLKLEIDPDNPPRFSKNRDTLSCECIVRVYPSSSAKSVYSTSGTAALKGTSKTAQMVSVLEFAGESVASLEYLPIGMVSVVPVKIYEVYSKYGVSRYEEGEDTPGVVSFLTKGATLSDIEIGPSGEVISSEPRLVDDNEVVASVGFGFPARIVGLAQATYTTSYDEILVTFELDTDDRGGRKFKETTIYAVDSQGRAGSLKVSGPSLKSRSRSFKSDE